LHPPAFNASGQLIELALPLFIAKPPQPLLP
jgi:hypothetical protein